MNAMAIYGTGILIFTFTFVLVINILGIENIVATSIGWVCASLIILLLLICWLDFTLSFIKTKREEKSSVTNVNSEVEFKVNKNYHTFDKRIKRKSKSHKTKNGTKQE